MLRLFLLIFILPFFACGQTTTSSPKDGEETAAYTQAISAYLKAVHETEKLNLDTLFIGKHQDFPAIALPSSVGQTQLLVLDIEAANKKLAYRKSLVYVNIVGTVTQQSASFLFVTFIVGKSAEGAAYWPQFNCLMDFTYDAEKQRFEMDREVSFEYYDGYDLKKLD